MLDGVEGAWCADHPLDQGVTAAPDQPPTRLPAMAAPGMRAPMTGEPIVTRFLAAPTIWARFGRLPASSLSNRTP